MHINPAIEPWLERLLEGVRNSNNAAEVMATKAFYAGVLVMALQELIQKYEEIIKDDTVGRSMDDEALVGARAILAKLDKESGE